MVACGGFVVWLCRGGLLFVVVSYVLVSVLVSVGSFLAGFCGGVLWWFMMLPGSVLLGLIGFMVVSYVLGSGLVGVESLPLGVIVV